jgi:hypothetical protein
MNWKKTEEFYKTENHQYNKPQEQIDLERWEAKVMRRGQYMDKAGDPTQYPTKRLVQAKRLRDTENREFLKGFWEYIGVDGLGNKVTTTVQDPEVYIKPEFIRELKAIKTKENPNPNPNDPQPVITEVRLSERVYTVPYTPENVDKMFEGQQKNRVSMVIFEESEMGAILPRQITNFEEFRNKAFDDLYKPVPLVESDNITRHKNTAK